MSDEDKSSKTEQPTDKRLQEAKRKGVPQSRDFNSAVTLMVAMVTLYATGGHFLSGLKASSRELLTDAGRYQVTEAGVYALMLRVFTSIGEILAPFLLVVMVAGLVVGMGQGGFSFSMERLTVDFSRLDPIKGFSRLFNKKSLVELVKSVLKILLVGFIAYRVIRGEVDSILWLTEGNLEGIFGFVSHISYKLVIHTGGVLLVLAALDLAFVKWSFIQDLKMTKEEVKDESRQSEGDPKVKGKIRRMQLEKAARRMSKVIPTADVVVTNPTHFAVALKYDRLQMVAPVVIAKGADDLAFRIRELAKEHRIPLVENKPLARELFATVKEGQPIPEGLYGAVAEVLAYVYSLKGKL